MLAQITGYVAKTWKRVFEVYFLGPLYFILFWIGFGMVSLYPGKQFGYRVILSSEREMYAS
jgi:hypothetical protein